MTDGTRRDDTGAGVTTRVLEPETWHDVVAVFEGTGGSDGCW